MSNQQGQAFEDLRNTISECSRIVRHRWRLALVGLTLASSIAFWFSQYLPREYAAASLFERRDDVVLQNLVKSNSPYGFDRLRSTLTLDMTGQRALANACIKLGLCPSEAFTGDGALSDTERSELEGALGPYKIRAAVQLLHSSASLDTINLRCEANDPRMARDFVVALRGNYIADTRERIREILHDAKEFFAAEVDRLQQEVTQSEATLRADFDEFPGLDPTNVMGVGDRLETLRARHGTLMQRQAELEAQIEAREEFLLTAAAEFAGDRVSQGTLPAGPPAEAAGSVDPILEKAIAGVRQELVALVTDRMMTMDHPDVRRLRGRLSALEELRTTIATIPVDEKPELMGLATQGLSPVQLEWHAQKMRVELEIDSLRRQEQVAEERVVEIAGRLSRFENLYDKLLNNSDDLRLAREQRGESAAELAIWNSYLARLERVLTAESGERGTQFTLIEEPQVLSRPVRPRLPTIFVVCVGLGLAAAALFVALAELFDRSFRSVGQVTRVLGVPVLECINVIATPTERRKVLRARLFWVPTLTVLLLALTTTGGLAYASIARPALHERAMQKVDRILNTVGVALVLPSADQHD